MLADRRCQETNRTLFNGCDEWLGLMPRMWSVHSVHQEKATTFMTANWFMSDTFVARTVVLVNASCKPGVAVQTFCLRRVVTFLELMIYSCTIMSFYY